MKVYVLCGKAAKAVFEVLEERGWTATAGRIEVQIQGDNLVGQRYLVRGERDGERGC